MGWSETLGISKSGDWDALPQALGMTVDENKVLRGTWDGHIPLRGVHTYEVIEYRNDDGRYESYTRNYTALSALLDPPLFAGLKCHIRPASLRLKDRVFGANDLQIGHEALDRLYDISAADPPLAQALMRDLHTLLPAVHPSLPNLLIDDDYVRVEIEGWTRDLAQCRTMFEIVGRIAVILRAARDRTSTAWEPAFRESWSRVASAWGLALDAPHGKMSGNVRAIGVDARVRYEGHRLQTEVSLALPSVVPASFQLTPQGSNGFFSKLFRGQDIQIGYPAFDAMFVVKGEPEAQVRAILTPKACDWLMAAHTKLGGFRLDRQTLQVVSPKALLDARELQAYVELCFATAESLVPQMTPQAPFR
ncbi:MAG: hypothetical protein Q8Q09_18570 [Deltaproteobacteria bacterium]|nr:hypothetical protein [Deltaproteobacteria bacterium]